MSGSGIASGRPPKTMSNRLMTMKFMQRASSASSPSQSAQSPTGSEPSSAKRQKISHASTSTPGSPLSPGNDAVAVRAALAAEEARRSAALDKLDIGSGETKWVFSYFNDQSSEQTKRPAILEYGKTERKEDENDRDHEIEPWGEDQRAGRLKFGAWASVENEDREDTGSSENSDSEKSEPGAGYQASTVKPIDPEAAAQARKKRKAKKKADMKDREKLAMLRRSKDVNLNHGKKQSLSGRKRR